MRKTIIALCAAVTAVASGGCADLREPVGAEPDAPPQFTHTASCDLRPVLDAARRYLKPPLQQEVSEKLRAMQSGGCTGAANELLAWEVLAIVEHVFHNRLGGAAADGARLVDGVLHCCIPQGGSFALDARVLGDGGIFGVRGALPQAAPVISNTAPILGRDVVPLIFGAEDGTHVVRPAVFAVRPRPPHNWQDVAPVDVTLITGFPFGAGPYTAYELDEAPAVGFEPGTHVDVIVCFMDGADAPADPHGPAGEHAFAARLKRNSVLLRTVDDAEAFCRQWVWQNTALHADAPASRLRSVVHLAARLLLPRPLLAALRDDRTTPALGGGASGFSRFSPTNAGTDGSLRFVQPPPAVVASTSTAFTIAVQARSGGGTAMEQVAVTLHLETNLGVPAAIVGTFTDCDGTASTGPVACTSDDDGTATVSIWITKPGGYVLCARGALDGFSFDKVCSERFHVRN